LNGTINMRSESYIQGGLGLTYDPVREDYYYLWETSGLEAYQVYSLEASIWDPSGNGDFDGSNPYGHDHAIALTDTIAPVIETVSAAVDDDSSGYYEIGSMITLTIIASDHEDGLSGTVKISRINGTLEEVVGTLYVFGSGAGTYRANWSTNDQSSGFYGVEGALQDQWGNTDSDGSNTSGLDLFFHLKDTTAPEIAAFQALHSAKPITHAEIGEDIQLQVIMEEMALSDDDRHTLIEMHVDIDLPEPFEDADGIARPYVVTIDLTSRTILAIRRKGPRGESAMA